MRSDDSEIIIYQTEDGATKIDVRIENETVWLTQAQMVDLFQTTKQNISLHINNVFEEGELGQDSVVKEYLTTAADGKNYRTKHYNLDVIISVGYRVKSLRGTQFRINHQPMYMKDWVFELDDFAKRYGKGILTDAGTVSYNDALEKAEQEYKKYLEKTKDELSSVERDYLESVKKTQKKLEGKAGSGGE